MHHKWLTFVVILPGLFKRLARLGQLHFGALCCQFFRGLFVFVTLATASFLLQI